MKKILIAAMLMTGILLYGTAEAVPTKLVIRAKSKDAKFVGTKMGGAMVTIKDSNSGKVLASGLTKGSTGNTRKIMINPKTRFGSISKGAAKFVTSINIDEPTLITIDIDAPMVTKPNLIRSSTQMWLIPGKDITGEGIIIEIPGFSVVARAPEKVTLKNSKAVIPFQSQIVMIWGCALTPGGLWDSNKYDINALVKYNGKIIDTVPLSFAGPSIFRGRVNVSKKGGYEIIVYAFDAQTGNTGADKIQVTVN